MIERTPDGSIVRVDLIDEEGVLCNVSVPLEEFLALSEGLNAEEQRIALLTWKSLQAAA
jgi:hypothetical protein